MSRTSKDFISYSEYLQFLGLMKLAEKHTDTLRGIEHAISEIIGDESGDLGCDAVYSGLEPDEFLERFEIKVVTQ